MKRILLLIAAAILLLSGCDRFDSEFDKHLTDFFDELSNTVQSVSTVDDVDRLMAYYSEDYLNDGANYADKLNWYETMLGDKEWNLHVTIDRFTEGDVSKIKWILGGDDGITDMIFSWTFVDCVQKVGGDFKFVGNRAAEAFADVQTEYVADLADAITNSDFATLASYFIADYYNNGVGRDSLFNLFDDISPSMGVTTTILNYDAYDNSFVYEITENSTGFTLRVDDTYTVVDGEYIFCGNGQDAPDLSKQKVLVELFTGTWCPNCPTSEQVLHDLKEIYGDKFYYVEYHISDSYDGFFDDNDELLDYYLGNIECPTAVFQGQLVMNGGISGQSQYEIPLNDYLAVDARALLSDGRMEWSGADNEMMVYLDIDLDEYMDETDLIVRYALVEETAQSNGGDYYHQAVLWKGGVAYTSLEASSGNFDEDYRFNFEYAGDLPDDTVLYVWLQTMHTQYGNDCKVYNVIEVPIEGI